MNNPWRRFSILVLFLWPSLSAAKEMPVTSVPEDSFHLLQSALYFAIGPVGEGGETSPYESAFQSLLKEKDAVSRLQDLLKSANNEGKMYALVGLRRLDRSAFSHAVARRKRNFLRKRKVILMEGCISHKSTDTDLMERMEKGIYD